MQGGKFDIHLDHRGLEPSVNRLVLGMLASALFVGSSLLLSRGVPPLMICCGSLGGRRGGRRGEHRPGAAPLAGDQQVGPPRSAAEGLTNRLVPLRLAVEGDSPIFVNHRCATVPAKIGTVPRLRRLRRRGPAPLTALY